MHVCMYPCTPVKMDKESPTKFGAVSLATRLYRVAQNSIKNIYVNTVV